MSLTWRCIQGLLTEILNGLYQRTDISQKDIPPLGIIPAGTGNG